jgi:benzil reductase ((S)-benzoin forming)
MTEYIISGGYTGLAEALISEISQKARIQYLSRKEKKINNQNAVFNKFDFRTPTGFHKFNLKIPRNTDEIIFLNNAAILGQITNFSKSTNHEIIDVYNINFLSPIILIKSLIEISENIGARLIVVNFTSGLTSYPINHLVNYIVSKKAMLFFLEILKIDLNGTNFESFSIDPGMLDTKMQEELRKSKSSSSPFFEEKFKNKSLRDVSTVAKCISLFLEQKKWKDGEIYHISQLENSI